MKKKSFFSRRVWGNGYKSDQFHSQNSLESRTKKCCTSVVFMNVFLTLIYQCNDYNPHIHVHVPIEIPVRLHA